ncbi:hypothetical protein BH10PSE19_BH10PSE19_00740 [soil metagenome]
MTMYRTEVHHVNINVGDCTLILVFQRDDKQTEADEKLARSVLIDGGTRGAAGRVLEFLQLKNKALSAKLPTNTTQLKLDLIIVTHDDEDHIGGIAQLFQSIGFTPFLKKDNDVSKRTFLCDQGMAEKGAKDFTQLYKDYVKLAEAVEANNYINRLTKVPSIKCLADPKALKTGAIPANKLADNYKETPLETAIYQGLINKQSVPRKIQTSIQDTIAEYNQYTDALRIGIKNGTIPSNFYATIATGNNLTASVYCDKRLLGYDLLWLNQTELDVKNDAHVANGGINELRAGQIATDRLKPALFCIGINGAFMKPKAAGLQIIYPDGTTTINQRSLALIMVTPDPENKVVYYLCGDLGETGETLILDWLKKAAVIDANKNITVVKLSHHGSRGSTPYRFLEDIKPEHIAVSVGDKHHHPSMATVFYAFAMRTLTYVDATIPAQLPLKFTFCATNFPYYLNTPTLDTLITNFKSITKNALAAGDVEADAKLSMWDKSITANAYQKYNNTFFNVLKLRSYFIPALNQEINNVIGAYAELKTVATAANFPADAVNVNYPKQLQTVLTQLFVKHFGKLNEAALHQFATAGKSSPSTATAMPIISAFTDCTNAMKAIWGIFSPQKPLGTNGEIFFPIALQQTPKLIALTYNLKMLSDAKGNTVSEALHMPSPVAAPIAFVATAAAMADGGSQKKAFKALPVTLSESSNTYLLAANNYINNDFKWKVTADCSLNNFLNALLDSSIIITNATATTISVGNLNWQLNGILGSCILQTYLAQIFSHTVSITLRGQLLTDGTVNIETKDIILISCIDVNDATKDITVTGTFTSDNQIQFTIDKSNTNISIANAMTSLGDNFSVTDSVNYIETIGALSAAHSETTFPIEQNPDFSYVVFNFDEFGYPQVEFQLTCNANFNVSLPNVAADTLSLNGCAVNVGKSVAFYQDMSIAEEYMTSMVADLLVMQEVVKTKILITQNIASLSFQPQGDIVSDLLDKLFGSANNPLTQLSQMGLGFKLIDKVLLTLDTQPLSLLQTKLQGNFTIGSISVDVSVTYPDLTIYGELNEVADNNLSDLLNVICQNLSLPEPGLATLKLSTLNFSLDPTNKVWWMDVSIGDPTIPVWNFCDAINLQDISLNFIVAASKLQELSLGASFNLGSTLLDLQGTYILDADEIGWEFNAGMSTISSGDLLQLLTKDDNAVIDIFKKLVFNDINIALNLADKSFFISGFASIGSSTLSISYDTSIADNADPTEKLFTMTWADNTPISLASILQPLGLTDLIPADIALPISQLELNFNFCSNTLLIDIVTAFGQAALIVVDNPQAQAKILTLNFGLSSSVHGIPMLGSMDNPLQTMQLLSVAGAVNNTAIAYINDIIASSDTLQLQLPPLANNTQCMPNGIGLYIDVDSTQPPLIVSLGGNSNTLHATTNANPVTVWLNVSRAIGPVLLNRIGIAYDKKLSIKLDAQIMLGAMTLSLQGFSFGFALDELLSATNFIPSAVQLDGLGLGFSAEDVTIAGDFLKELDSDNLIRYSGVAILAMEQMNVAAVGSYTKLKSGDPAVFIFARIGSEQGFGGPPCFYVKGFSGGFGYNWQLRLPLPDEVVDFPLVQGNSNPNVLIPAAGSVNPWSTGTQNNSPVANALNVLQVLTTEEANGKPAWLTPVLGEDWLAVGIDFTTFELVQSQALLVAEFGLDFQLALLGRSSMQLPKFGSPIAYIEMGLEAIIKPTEGTLAVTALISPNSYVLTPQCHLTGGFAFFSWSKDQLNGASAGDFAFTMGGYHPSFKVPTWYPQVQRLGFNWQVSNTISISGESYFALTSSAAMMGGALQAIFQAGDLKAWFTTSTDFLIEWHPFHYQAEIGVSVGASYRLNLLFSSATVSIEIGANLELWGPPTGGNVDVNWSIISFSIPFGSIQSEPQAITWQEFRSFLPRNAAVATPSSKLLLTNGSSDNSDTTQLSRIMVEQGLNKQITRADQSSCWIVRADEFCFHTDSSLPLTSINLNNIIVTDENNNNKPDAAIYIKPMRSAAIDNTHVVTLNQVELDAQGNISKVDTTPIDITHWHYQIIKRNLPDALWGKPSTSAVQGADASLNTALLPGYWVGLAVQAPAAIAGASAGVIAIKQAFSVVAVKNAVLPLNISAETYAAPTVDSTSRQIIHNSIATVAASARQQVVADLQSLKILNAELQLDSMSQFANNPNQYLFEAPLIIVQNI